MSSPNWPGDGGSPELRAAVGVAGEEGCGGHAAGVAGLPGGGSERAAVVTRVLAVTQPEGQRQTETRLAACSAFGLAWNSKVSAERLLLHSTASRLFTQQQPERLGEAEKKN